MHRTTDAHEQVQTEFMSAVSYINTLNEEEKERVRRIRQERTELAREERHRNLESLHNLELVPSTSFSLSLSSSPSTRNTPQNYLLRCF